MRHVSTNTLLDVALVAAFVAGIGVGLLVGWETAEPEGVEIRSSEPPPWAPYGQCEALGCDCEGGE